MSPDGDSLHSEGSPQQELFLAASAPVIEPALRDDFPAQRFGQESSQILPSVIALDPERYLPALQSSFSNRSDMLNCPRLVYEHLRRSKGRELDSSPEDRSIYLMTSLKSLPEVLGGIVHDAIAFALSEACGKQLGQNQFAAPRIVSLDELLNRSNREYARIIGLSAGASRLHFASDPKRFPLLIEDAFEMHGIPFSIGGRENVPAHVWRAELWDDIKTCLTNFYSLFFAPKSLTLNSAGQAEAAAAGFSALRPGRFPYGDFISIEGWRELAFSSDSSGAGGRSASWPHFTLPITHRVRLPDGTIRRQGYEAKNICILDFAYAEPDRNSWKDGEMHPGKVIICDWKTNQLDPETGRPFGAKARHHLEQLAEYGVYMLGQFPELEPKDIIIRVYYLRGDKWTASERVEEYSVESLDSSPGLERTRQAIRKGMEDRANRFIDPLGSSTDIRLWPTTDNKSHCQHCKVAGSCDGAPHDVRAKMSFPFVTVPHESKQGALRIIDEGLSG